MDTLIYINETNSGQCANTAGTFSEASGTFSNTPGTFANTHETSKNMTYNIEQLFTPSTNVSTASQIVLFSPETDWEPVFQRVGSSSTVLKWQRDLVGLLVQHLSEDEWTIINLTALLARLNGISRTKLENTFAMLLDRKFMERGERHGQAYAYRLIKTPAPEQPGTEA